MNREKSPSAPAARRPGAIDTRELVAGAAGRRSAGDTPNSGIDWGRASWRVEADHKSTWIGAEIGYTSHLAVVRELVELRKRVEAAITEEVGYARNLENIPWSMLGPALGTTPEAARQRFGK